MRLTSASLLGLANSCWASRWLNSDVSETCVPEATKTVFVTVYPPCPTSVVPTTTIIVSPIERSSHSPHAKTVSQFTTITVPDLFSGISSSTSLTFAMPTGQSAPPFYGTEQTSFTEKTTSAAATSSDGSQETNMSTDASESFRITRLLTQTVTRTVSLAPQSYESNASGQTSGAVSATIASTSGDQTICSTFTVIGPNGKPTATSATIVVQSIDTASVTSKTRLFPTQSSSSGSGIWFTGMTQVSTASFPGSGVRSSSKSSLQPDESLPVYGDSSQAKPTQKLSETTSNTPWLPIPYDSIEPTSLPSLQPYVVLSQQPSEWASSILSGAIPNTLASPAYTPCNTTSLLTSTWVNIIPEPTTTYTLDFPMTTLITVTIPPLVPFGRRARRQISESSTQRENTVATDFTTRTLAGNSAVQASLSSLLGHTGTQSAPETIAEPNKTTTTPQTTNPVSTPGLTANSSTLLSWSIPVPPTTPSSSLTPSDFNSLSTISIPTVTSGNETTTAGAASSSSNFSTPVWSSALATPVSITSDNTPTALPTSSPVIGTLLSTLFSPVMTPTLPVTPTDTSTVVPTPSSPLPPQCPLGGRVGNFTLDFDKLEAGPLLNPAEDLWFSEGFLVAPPSSPPFNAYVPSSGGNLVEFVPPGLSPILSPSGSGDVAEIGVGPNFSNPCYKLDFFGASLGCAAEGVERWCEFEVSAFTHNSDSSTETSMAWSEIKRVPACPTFPSGTCKLTPVEFDGYTNVTSIIIRLRVGLELRVWWGDDFKFGWSDNSCEASRCRTDAANKKAKRELIEHTVARGVWQWTPYGLKRLDDAYIYASAH